MTLLSALGYSEEIEGVDYKKIFDNNGRWIGIRHISQRSKENQTRMMEGLKRFTNWLTNQVGNPERSVATGDQSGNER